MATTTNIIFCSGIERPYKLSPALASVMDMDITTPQINMIWWANYAHEHNLFNSNYIQPDHTMNDLFAEYYSSCKLQPNQPLLLAHVFALARKHFVQDQPVEMNSELETILKRELTSCRNKRDQYRAQRKAMAAH